LSKNIQEEIVNNGNYWFPYQQQWLDDESKIKIWEKSRQIGATFVQSYEDFKDAASGKYENIWFSSTNEDAGKEYLRYVEKWVKLYQAKVKFLQIDSNIVNKDNDIKSTVIEFSNGSRINILSSDAKNFRGKKGKIILDEFAVHEDQEGLWAAAFPCIIHGGCARIMSTHWDKKVLFWNLIHNMPHIKASHHRTNIYKAVEQGLYDRLVELGETEEKTKDDFINWLRYSVARGNESIWQREFLLNPIENCGKTVVDNWDDTSIDGNVRSTRYVPYIPKKFSPLGKDEENDLYITCDFNVSPNCWEIAHVTNKIENGKYVLDSRGDKIPEKVYFFDEFCVDMYTEELIKVVMDKYCGHPSRIVIMGDASGNNESAASTKTNFKHIENELIRRGFLPESNGRKRGKRFLFRLTRSNSSRLERFSAWNKMVLDPETKERRIIIDKVNCPKLNYNCLELQIVPNTESKYYEPALTVIQKYPDMRFLGHPYDAASYLVDNLFHVEKEKLPRQKKKDTYLEAWRKQGKRL
jgi:hypothetical protein